MILNINRYKPKKPLHNWATKQSLAVARGFGWDGLSAIGKITVPPLLTDTEETNFMNLQQIPLNDSNTQSCDE
jgi:hypothetical protein